MGFIYVFSDEGRDILLARQYELLKSDEAKHIYVFAMKVHYSFYPDTTALEINAERLNLLAYACTSVGSVLQIATAPIGAYVRKSFGRGCSGIEVISNVEAAFKHDLERAHSNLVLEAEALSTKKKVAEQAVSSIVVDAEPPDLFYRMCCTAAPSVIQIANSAVEAEIHYSLGRCTFPITLDSQVLGEQMAKHLTTESVIEIQSSADGTLKQFFVPEVNTLKIVSFEVEAIMENKVEKAEKALNERIDKTDEVVAAKADNIIFNEEDSTIQLVSTIPVLDEEGNIVEFTQIPLGTPIFVRADTARGIINMEINEVGDLIVTFDDEETQNLGTVIGKDGSVYVPHVDAHKVLAFTVESELGEVPDPVDLNPNDEWNNIDESGMDSSVVTATTAGVMSAEDKVTLDAVVASVIWGDLGDEEIA